MVMNIEEIQSQWERDSKLDPDNLHLESLKIPGLHSKYYNMYNNIRLLREKSKSDYAEIKLQRYNYYTGKAPAEIYVQEPFPYKVRDKEALKQYLEADNKLSQIDLKVKYYDIMLEFLEEIIKNLNGRTYQIKNAIEWQRFQAGFS